MAVTNDLVTDRRVMRHAATLREAGYEVILVGRNELGVKAKRGWRFYAEYNMRLWRRLLKMKADVVWANDTDTLLGCCLAVFGEKKRRPKLVMDAHELFPEVPELVGRERVKRVWETLERKLMPKCDALLTVCQSIADYYRQKYGVEMAVVRNMNEELMVKHPEGEPNTLEKKENVVRNEESADAADNSSLKTLLYQGCVNKGRGVDWAIDALEWLPDCRLVIAGNGDLMEEMKAYAKQKPWSGRVLFLGRLLPEELERLTPKADVGLVMLEDMGLSYHFALPNRIGDFVAAGVPMVVSDLPEMAAVVRKFGVGEVIEIDDSKLKNEKICAQALAEAVKRVMAREWKEEDFAAAREDMDWKKEKVKLINIIENI